MPFSSRAFALLVLALLAFPITALAQGDPSWLEACQTSGTAKVECLSAHLQELQDEQENDLSVLHTVLDTKGPPGTDFDAARALLTESHAAWERFAQSDCRMLDLIMGDFGAMGGEALYCLIEHYETRNAQILRWIDRVE